MYIVTTYLSTKIELKNNATSIQSPNKIDAKLGSISVLAFLKMISTFMRTTVIPQKCCKILSIVTIISAFRLLLTVIKSKAFPFSSVASWHTVASIDNNSSVTSGQVLNRLKCWAEIELFAITLLNSVQN